MFVVVLLLLLYCLLACLFLQLSYSFKHIIDHQMNILHACNHPTPFPPTTSTQHGCIAGQLFPGDLHIICIGQAPPPPQRHDEGVLHPPGCCCRGRPNSENVAAVFGAVHSRLPQRFPYSFTNLCRVRNRPSSNKNSGPALSPRTSK